MRTEEQKKIKGAITISRRGMVGEPIFCITIEDRDASIGFIEVLIDGIHFADAIGGVAFQECELFVSDLSKVGKLCERKEEFIEVPSNRAFQLSREELDTILESFEIDGWIGSRYDLNNSKNRQSDGKWRVSFYRWVEKE